MYIPLEQHTTRQDELEDFLVGVEKKFEYAMAAYKRSVIETEFDPDMSTTKFSFTVVNGGLAESVLEDEQPYYDN